MFGFQPIHLVAIFLVALIVFGPNKLPEIGRGVGKAIVEFRKGARELSEGFQAEVNGKAQSTPAVHQNSSFYPQTQSGNFCTSCGVPNPIEARFCNQCGSSILPAVSAVSSEPLSLPLNDPGELQTSQ